MGHCFIMVFYLFIFKGVRIYLYPKGDIKSGGCCTVLCVCVCVCVCVCL